LQQNLLLQTEMPIKWIDTTDADQPYSTRLRKLNHQQ